MIEKELFRKTEKKLYNYYCKDKKIESLNKKIELLEKQINEIDKKIKNVDVSIPEESRGTSFEERVQTSNDCASYAEKTLIRITESLIIEKNRKKEENIELEQKIRQIQSDNIIMETNIKNLNNDDKKFLELKYGQDNLKDWQIGMKLEVDQSTVTRKRQKLVEEVARWEQWQHR